MMWRGPALSEVEGALPGVEVSSKKKAGVEKKAVS
jgi:hypothetical protein